MKWFNARRHPLSRFPGPFHARFSNFSYCKRFLGGRQPYDMLKLHERYGPVVRVGPNELAFNTANSWKDIYEKRKGHKPFIKSDFYDGGNFADEAHSIVSERDPDKHAYMRKYLRGAFSDRSLREQEYIIREHIDQFIERISEAGCSPGGIDIVMWFNLATFDIIGSLAFGQSFGGVASGNEHFWVSIVVKSLRMGALADTFKRFPLLAAIFQRMFPQVLSRLIEDSKRHQAYTMDLVQKRIKQKSDRRDFLTNILEARETDRVSDVQIAAHASDFVIAGSETTATALSCITYYLQRNPDVLQNLRREIRDTFKSYDEIDGVSTTSLPYLNAVILEGMRLYPPLPFPLPRVVPEGGDMVDGHFIPGGTIVSTNPFAASMSSENFRDPYKFDPERWLTSDPQDILDASQPFSLGPRGCLGKSLGWLEMRLFLAKIHYKYDLELVDPALDWHAQSEMHTLWQKPALKMIVRPRKH
ncbi:benzoate 4-monooxygenase cytochrome P450 [Pseudomassariella vexata]|uniref:Benzoate 4-monooxygenase cytochrome P450 n=1 Tax=Pseudomassariella vexata TaxID=1141098 RepID=A0A1Y2E3T2_9PEZI|nr:benzoate 4-monooxygenase cytochrome P450 [Pseudomassariella vexata]ORY66218.1 benzoate 4-monooxygenase cytochrome P450 [Pseudomassariella vexata]